MGRRSRDEEKQHINNKFNPLEAKNRKQKEYFSALHSHTIVFGVGVAGTGKSACAISYALSQIQESKIDKIVLTRPAEEAAGESLGFLPGKLQEKYEPYIMPIREIGYKVVGKSTFDMWVKDGTIEAVPMGFMRGRTFDDSIIVCDEMQNASREQMLMLLTRLGHNSKMFINGDNDQKDKKTDGLQDAIFRLEGLPFVKIVEFEIGDIVRSGYIGSIIHAYS